MEVDKLIQRKHDLQIRLREVLEQEIEDFQEETGVHIKSITAPVAYMLPSRNFGDSGVRLQWVTVELEL